MKKTLRMFVGLVLFAALLAATTSVMSADVPKMTKEELKALLDKGEVVLLDLRSGKDWKASEFIIEKAVREDPSAVESWANKYHKEKTLVLYCA